VTARLKLVAASIVIVAFAVGAFAAFTSTSRSGTLSQQVASWVAGANLGSSIGTLEADIARIGTVLGQGKGLSVVQTDCIVLEQDATAANGDLPTPDPTLTKELSRAYTLAYDAGADCDNAGSLTDASFRRATVERRQAREAMRVALARAERLTGKTVATTTTTQPPSGGLFG